MYLKTNFNSDLGILKESLGKFKHTEGGFQKPISVKINGITKMNSKESDYQKCLKSKQSLEEDRIMGLINIKVNLPILSLTHKVKPNKKEGGTVSALNEIEICKTFKIERKNKHAKSVDSGSDGAMFKITKLSKSNS